MSLGLVGKKIGMTREFFESGVSIPVTVLRIEKGRVIDIYTKEKNGYSAVKLGLKKKAPTFFGPSWLNSKFKFGFARR